MWAPSWSRLGPAQCRRQLEVTEHGSWLTLENRRVLFLIRSSTTARQAGASVLLDGEAGLGELTWAALGRRPGRDSSWAARVRT